MFVEVLSHTYHIPITINSRISENERGKVPTGTESEAERGYRSALSICRRRRAIARQERGRVHGVQTSRPRVPDDDCFNALDAIHADDLGPSHHRHLPGIGTCRLAEASPKACRHSRVGGTQDDENASATLQSVDSGSARGAAVAGNDEIDCSDHCVGLAGAGQLTTTGPLNVRKKASS